MANTQNLIPGGHRITKEEASKGGKKSAEVRRARKNTAQLVKAMLESTIDPSKEKAIKKVAKDLPADDMTVNALMTAGMIKSAISGNVQAFETLQAFRDKASAIEDINRNWCVPITDITVDFVEVYRAVHESFESGKYREIISKGGRGSIKSNFWAAVAEEVVYQDPKAHVVYTRRYKTDLRGSVYHQFQKTVMRHGKAEEWEFTTSPMMAKYKKTGQCVLFVGCDKPISLKSYNLPFGYVKLLIHEECDEMAGVEQMDNVEDTFLRANTPSLDVKVFNPPKSASNFMNKYAMECMSKDGTFVTHSYYYNVPVKWLGQRFFDRANWFKEHKPKYYANNYLGEVVGTGGQIFENLEVRAITDEEIAGFGFDLHYGLDFGYEHPQTFIVSHYDSETDTIYPIYEVWAKRCRNANFAKKIEEYKSVEIIADSARPDNIADMNDWGFDVIGAVKRWKNKGRAYCWEWLQQAAKIVVDPARTPHLASELQTLEHEQLRDGTFSSEYPDLGEDCTMALIYGLNRVIMEHTRGMDYLDDDEEEYDNE